MLTLTSQDPVEYNQSSPFSQEPDLANDLGDVGDLNREIKYPFQAGICIVFAKNLSAFKTLHKMMYYLDRNKSKY